MNVTFIPNTQRPQPNYYQKDDDTRDEQEEVKLDSDRHEFALIADGYGVQDLAVTSSCARRACEDFALYKELR